jgi:hypothetical protein
MVRLLAAVDEGKALGNFLGTFPQFCMEKRALHCDENVVSEAFFRGGDT